MNNLLMKNILREDNHFDPNFTYLKFCYSGKKAKYIQNY